MARRTEFPCRCCKSNLINVESNYANSYYQVVCAHCGVRGPRINTNYSKPNDSEKMLKQAMNGWGILNKN